MVSYDVAADFPGGAEKLSQYIQKSFKRPKGIDVQGRIYVEFVVEEDGSISDPVIKKSLEPACDEEALRVVRRMPKWKPAMLAGKPVRSRMAFPFVVH